MEPVFGDDGLAIEAGEIRVYYYSDDTREYAGWSDEYVNIGVSMPGNSTAIDPGEPEDGKVSIFMGDAWKRKEDHRGATVYSTTNASESIVDYIGPVANGYTEIAPATPYDKWDGATWVINEDDQHAADVAAADAYKQQLLNEADAVTADWRVELMLGDISDEDKASLTEWMAYKKEVKAVDTSTAPDITWPEPPAA